MSYLTIRLLCRAALVAGLGYVVFGMDYSGWWLLLAPLIWEVK